jgi:hypothetical protein
MMANQKKNEFVASNLGCLMGKFTSIDLILLRKHHIVMCWLYKMILDHSIICFGLSMVPFPVYVSIIQSFVTHVSGAECRPPAHKLLVQR